MKSSQLKPNPVHKPGLRPKSLKAKKLKTAQTVINKNTEINQAWLDANPGPYAVQGGSKTNIIEITFLENLNVKQNTYFMIKTDYVNINGNANTLFFENIKDYVGLVQNTKFSNIIVSNIRNSGKNSSLLETSGWFLGSNYGINSIENKVLVCTNYLPISPYSGGIVGENSKIHAIDCINNGEFVVDVYKSSRSGGICAYNCTGTIENCLNNSNMPERCGGMIYVTNNSITIKNSSNKGNIGHLSAGMITFAVSNQENNNELIIENCDNIGEIIGGYNQYGNSSGANGICFSSEVKTTINNCINYGNIRIFYSNTGIIGYIENSTTISNCKNYGEIRGDAGIVYLVNSNDVEIKDCINYGNIDLLTASGIIRFTLGNNIKINNCINRGKLKAEFTSGILFRSYEEKVSVKNCKNYGNIDGQNSGGISTKFSPITVEDCTNHGVINGVGCGGIFASGTPKGSIAVNCVNNATVNGENAGGIFGAWSQGTAKSCKNGGKLVGLNAQPILGHKSTGKIE